MVRYSAIVTLLALAFYFWTGLRVGGARRRYGVTAPATVGNPDFERAYRVQMNTLEWLPLFLPCLWLFAIYVNDLVAALIGLVWIAGRLLYLKGYTEAADKRGPGFGIQALATAVLFIGAAIGIIRSAI